jgi:hypothetical protein
MVQSVTSPSAQLVQASMARDVRTRPDVAARAAAAEVAAVTSGNATRYWDELVPYPPGNPHRLWFYVNNSWKYLDNPNQGIKDMVQRAFLGSGSNVIVWYDDSVVVGLVVEGT